MSSIKGLPNRYLNCFLNCALQILLNFDKFNEIVVNYKTVNNNECQKQYCIILNQYHSNNSNVNLDQFYNFLVRKNIVEYKIQGDYHESLFKLIDCFDQSKQIDSLFKGTYQQVITCTKCYNYNAKHCQFYHIPLKANNKSIQQFTSSNIIENYKCDNCQKNTTATVILNITKWPKLLSLHSNFKQSKIRNIDYNIGITYKLYALVAHKGSQNSGHYYCYIFKNNLIYKLDDQSVQKINEIDDDNVIGIFYLRN